MKLRPLRKGYHLVGDAVSEIRVILLDLGPISLRRRHELAIASSMKGCDKAGARSDRGCKLVSASAVGNELLLSEWEVLPRDLTGTGSREGAEGKTTGKSKSPFLFHPQGIPLASLLEDLAREPASKAKM